MQTKSDKGKNKGAVALHYAAQQNMPEVVEYLIRQRASVNKQDARGCTPLHYAAYTGPCGVLAKCLLWSRAVALLCFGKLLRERACRRFIATRLLNRLPILLRSMLVLLPQVRWTSCESCSNTRQTRRKQTRMARRRQNLLKRIKSWPRTCEKNSSRCSTQSQSLLAKRVRASSAETACAQFFGGQGMHASFDC